MPKLRSPLRNRVEELALEVAVSLLSRRSVEDAEAFGRRLGTVLWAVLGRRRRLAQKNLARAFPERSAEEISRLAREVFRHFAGLAAELVRSIDDPVDALVARTEVVGLSIATAAAASGRGVFFLTAHIGNWEAGAIVTGALGMPITVVTRPLDNPALERRLRACRERSGNLVQPKSDAARALLRTLRRGGMVGILSDQHAHPPDNVVVPFLGRPASTTAAVARLADRTEALILPTFAIRTGPGRYRLSFGAPLDVRTLPPRERAVEPLTARLNAILEEPIRRHPEQWLWLHNRWRVD